MSKRRSFFYHQKTSTQTALLRATTFNKVMANTPYYVSFDSTMDKYLPVTQKTRVRFSVEAFHGGCVFYYAHLPCFLLKFLLLLTA